MRSHSSTRVLVTSVLGVALALGGGSAWAGPAEGEGEFSDPLTVDATFFPLVPGTERVYEGTVTDEEGVHSHQVVWVVTDVVKVVDGIPALVVWDRDVEDGELVEEELALFAQDDAGNVWSLGEYPEEREDGDFDGAPSTWLSGVDRASGGILVPADPQTGTRAFDQGRSMSIEFWDRGQVVETDVSLCVVAGCFDGVAVVDEWSPIDMADGHQQKYYAPAVGLVDILADSGDAQEELQLTRSRTLGRGQLRRAADRVLELDARAYVHAADVWEGSPPAERR
jgi:hypothetical protein